MHFLKGISIVAVLAAATFAAGGAQAQSVTNLNALHGLVPIATLGNTDAGKAALASDLTITAAVQDGSANQPLLASFTDAQQQALRDAYITGGNANELADALGSKLGTAYQALTPVTSSDDGKTVVSVDVSPAVARLFGFANATSGGDSNAGKYFFSNETLEGKTPVSDEAKAIMANANGQPDAFGRAYNLPGGSTGADPYGDSRPFQTEPKQTSYQGKDFFGVDVPNTAYLKGPVQDLSASPAYPSGHTTYGYTESLILAELVPERFQQMVTRGAEYGNNRIILGAHYAMDVLGGRTLASYDLAQLLADKPGYVGVTASKISINDFREALAAAKADLTPALEKATGAKIADAAKDDTSRFADPVKNAAFYEATQTYGLPVVYPQNVGTHEDISVIAPEAGYLLTVAFPNLTLEQADDILTSTEGPGGGFLDNGSRFGVYSRLDLYKAAGVAADANAKAAPVATAK